MEGSSSKGSSKRKPAFTMKIKVQSKKKLESESDNDDYDSDYSKRKPASKRDNSDYSDAESIPDLPEGTVVVKPEPVKEKKLRFSGPEFSKVPENLDIVNCTSCGRQINPNVSGAAKRHPELKVLVCRKCYSYYRSGNIEQDEDGLDEQCRWCGEGGRLLGCDHCHNAFCKSCIIRNFSRAELTTVMADDGSKWKCYVCDPSKLKKLLRECDSLFKKIEKEKLKAKTQSSIDLKKSSSSKPQKATGKSMSSKEHVTSKTHKNLVSFTNFKLNSSNVVNISTQLLGLSAGFHTMLEVLNVDLNTSGDVKNSSREANSKKDHGAKTLETGLKEFLRSLNTVLCDALKSKEKAPIENGETTEDESVLSNGHISLSDDDNSSDLSQQEIKVSWKSTSEGRQVKKGSKPEEQAHTKYRDGKKDQSKSPLRKDKMDISVDNDVFSNEVCDVGNDDSDEYDVPITFGPSDGAGDGHTISKDQNTELKADKSEGQMKDDIDSVKGSRPLSETENEAAQLELLKELAEEMCKEQKERKEEKKNEEEESSKVSEKESSQQEDKKHVSGDIKARSGVSSDNDEDSSMDDSVSSSDLLMSSDGDFVQSWSMRKSKEKGPRKSQKGTDEKLEKKKMKKKRKKLKKEKEERSLQRRKEEKKLKKKKPKDTGSEDDLEKEISKLEEEPEMKKKKKPKKEKTDSDVDTDEDTKSKKEKKEASDEEKKGTKTRGRKKVETSSSDDDENEFDDEVDEDDEDDVPKMRNGKNKAPESQNGKDLENEVAKKALMAELEDADLEGDDESGNDDSESEDDAKEKKKGAKKDKKPVKEEKDDDIDNDKENDSEDEDSDAVPNKRKRIRSKLLDAKLSDSESSSKDRKSKKKVKSEDSDSEEVVRKKSKKKKSSDEDLDSDSSLGKKKKRGRKKKKQKKKRGKKRKLTSDSESGLSSSSESASDSDSEISLDTEEEERREKLKAERKAKRKAKGNKRRRIKEQKDSSDEKGKAESDSDIDGTEDDDDDDDDDGKSPDKTGRKNIRKIKSDKKLTDDTKRARKAEESRRKRVSQRQKEFNHVVQITDEQTKCPITTQLILEMDKDKKDPLIEVNKKLVRKLKPHQVEAAQFMWDCLCETTERIKKKEGSGCILAHCMGLGKTLSVITFVHTMLANEQKTTMRTCLIVCPLNTVINWRNEWTMWFDEKDQLDVYEISSVKQNWPRADYLKDWHEGGGIMIIGYEMYRNLTQSARIKNKKLKAIFQKTLVDPGPDLVVCDEGHILKNDSSAISQALNKVRTRRRVVLTGTPLQNNLLEYHCMASFVKPNLMGTRKEFLNRFVNPITNGQHSDSTAFDVKVMGRRAHVLHEMLAGCVQRRDYSALTKFLPPKFEYVISVRLSPVQIDLYEKYLDLAGIGAEGGPPTVNKGARLFSDYQNLMKIWTHPWVLKLAEIRADNKMKYDDSEDSFIDNSTDEEIASMTDNSEDSLMAVSKSDSGESEKAGPSNRSSRRSRRGKPPPEDSDKEEVVKDWKTRSRGGEDGDDRIDLDDGPKPVSNEWWAEYVKEDDQSNLDLSGKLILLFEILRMCEEIGDKVLVFSQSLLSLDIIEYFLDVIDKRAEEAAIQKEKEEEEKLKGETDKDKEEKEEKDQNGDAKDEDKKEDDNDEFVQTVFGKTWTKGADYFRMDGSTSPQLRSQWSDFFNDPENFRARLFLISTKAGSLGINLVAANRVIIFDASWNPSHDIQSIFRVYRFGQTKPCYVYRFLAQGTMEEKIYERQVTKQSLSQRVVDEHQIDRHFTSADLSELYHFKPERLDDPNCPKTTHALPKDVLLAELLKHNQQIVRFHEHDSLLENREDQTLTEEEKKAAWEEYDNERKGISNRVAQASTASGVGMFSPDNVLQIVQMVKMRFPNLPPDLFQAQVQAILQQQILYQQSMQNQQIEQQRMMEMHRLQRIQNDIRSQQRQINDLTRNRMANPRLGVPMGSRMGMPFGMQHRPPNHPGALRSILTTPSGSSGKKDSSNARSTPPNNPPVVIDLSKS